MRQEMDYDMLISDPGVAEDLYTHGTIAVPRDPVNKQLCKYLANMAGKIKGSS
jgi:hypothetical protein